MMLSLQSSTSNVWNGDNSARRLTVPLRPLIGKEVTMDVPAQDVSGLNWMGNDSKNEDKARLGGLSL